MPPVEVFKLELMGQERNMDLFLEHGVLGILK